MEAGQQLTLPGERPQALPQRVLKSEQECGKGLCGRREQRERQAARGLAVLSPLEPPVGSS